MIIGHRGMTVKEFVYAHGVKIRSNRGGWLICCPYPEHDDSTPSFSINEIGLFYCWGCKRKGNYSRLLHDICGMSWKAAIKYADALSDFDTYGRLTTYPVFAPEAEKEHPTISNGLLGLYDADWEEGYARYLQAVANNEEHFPPWTFPFVKGFTPATLDHFEAGYDPDWQRVTIPVRSDLQHLSGFIGRTCVGSDVKYLVYPPLRPTFFVYNLYALTTKIDWIVLVEGAWDVWMLYQKCSIPAVAAMTTRLSEIQLTKLVESHYHYVLMFDRDKGGCDGAYEVAQSLTMMGVKVDIAMNYPRGESDLKALNEQELLSALDGRRPFPAPSALEMIRR